ncbi:MAG TPA: acyltransferase family protein [Actinomycetota bacterium]|nr:acyltransferase family protein [Actinomycetota bacterium]
MGRASPARGWTAPSERNRTRPQAPSPGFDRLPGTVRAPVHRTPGSHGAPLEHRNDVQGLRAVAVVLVVLWHAGVAFVPGGYVGVDVFFVLSGFLITRLLLDGAERRGHVSLREFYARRAKRILPAAALTLVVTDFAAVHLMNFVRAKEAVQDSVWAAVFAANIQLAHRGADYFAQGQPPSPVQHFWSLAVEEQFYLVWPLLLTLVLAAAGLRRRRASRTAAPGPARVSRNARIGLAATIALVGLGSLAWSVVETRRSAGAAYFSTFTRIWELAMGAALAIGASMMPRLPDRTRAVLGWTGLVAIVVAAARFSQGTAFPGSAALVPTTGAALVIAAGIGNEQSRWGVGRLLGIRPLGYVGDRSYALYLWHWPVLLIAAAYAGRALPVDVNLLLVAGAFLLSILSFRLVENPVRRTRLTRPVGTSAVLWGTSVGLVLAVAAFNLHAIAATSRTDTTGREPPPILHADAPTPGPQGAPPTLPADPTRTAIPAVVAAVQAARNGSPVPSRLIPPLGELLDDRYPPIPDCWGMRSDPDDLTKCTLFAGGSSGTIALIGDSHARQWLPAVAWTARSEGWSVVPLLHMGCWPASYVAGGECEAYVGWAEQQVRTLRPDVVLIGGELRFLGPDGIALSAQGIAGLVAAVRPFARHVVVIGDPPAREFQPVDCLLAHGATLASCTWTLTPEQIGVYRAAQLAATGAGAAFLDTWGWFCFERQCPTVVGHTVTYRENDHISPSYATELRELFRAAFTAEVSDPTGERAEPLGAATAACGAGRSPRGTPGTPCPRPRGRPRSRPSP